MIATIAVVSAVKDSLTDKLKTLNIKQLQSLALEAEKLLIQHKHEVSNLRMKDVVGKLSREELISYISDQVKANPFLIKGAALVKNAGLTIDNMRPYLERQSKERLAALARAGEMYDNLKKNKDDLTPDAFDSVEELLSKDMIINFVMSYLEQYEELQTREILSKIEKYGLMNKREFDALLEDQGKRTLVYMTAAAEKYERSLMDIQLMGGICDYAWSLTKENLKSKIKEYAAKFPELYVKGFLPNLCLFKNVYVNELFYGGLGSYLGGLTNGEIKYIFSRLPSYFQNKFPWLKIEKLDDSNVAYYIDAIRRLIDETEEYRRPGVLEQKINFPVGGFEFYLSKLDTDVIRENAIKYCNFAGIYASSEYLKLARDFESAERDTIIEFLVNEIQNNYDIVDTEFFKHL